MLYAYFMTIETQGRGSLHAHFILWTPLSPDLIATVAEYPHVNAAISNVLSKQFTTELPLEVVMDTIIRKIPKILLKIFLLIL